MNNDYVYFIGGPADLTKQAFPAGRVPPTIDIVDPQSAGYYVRPTDEIKYVTHTYIVHPIGPNKPNGRIFLAVHPDAMG